MPKTVKQLLEQRAVIITNARSLFDEITDTTTEERAAEIKVTFDRMISDANALEVRANDLGELERAEASLGAGDPRAPRGGDIDERGDNPPADVDYRSAFYQFLGAAGDMSNLSPEARAAMASGRAVFSGEQRAQTAGTGSAGGHLVPDEAMQEIVKVMAMWGPMLDDDLGTVINTVGGGSIPIPGLDDTGNEAAQTVEGAELTNDGGADVGFVKETLDDYMFDTEFVKFTIQLATSGMVNVEQLLGSLLGERLGRKANRVLTVGTGAGEPQGIVTGASVGLTAASNSAITSDEVQKFLHSMDPAYRLSPKYGAMFNDTTLSMLHAIKDGQGNYLIQEAPDMAGRLRVGAVSAKYKINQAVSDVGPGNRSMVAGDFGRYFVRKIGNAVIGVMQDTKTWPNFGIAVYQRLDGVVADSNAIKAMVHPV